jgi:hypothetical protein
MAVVSFDLKLKEFADAFGEKRRTAAGVLIGIVVYASAISLVPKLEESLQPIAVGAVTVGFLVFLAACIFTGPMRGKSGLADLQRRFFGFVKSPDQIEIVLPAVGDRNPPPALACDNYPLYTKVLSPDDVYTALEVHTVLSAIYRSDGKEIIVHVQGEPDARKESGESRLTVYIGGAPTNSESAAVVSGSSSPFTYDPKDGHVIVSASGARYQAESREDKIVKDYSFISRFTTTQNVKSLVLSGCRAYGQTVFYSHFLSSKNFYQVLLKHVGENDFQAILPIRVSGKKASWDGKVEAFKIIEKAAEV